MPIPFRVTVFVTLPMLAAGSALATDVSPLPLEQVQGDVRYVTGGVGSDEVDAMRQAASHYPLVIEFAAKPVPSDSYPRDVYLANVRVDIRDQQGQTLIGTTTDGPMLFASLPPGRYTINAETAGISKQKSVEVGRGGSQRVLFEFAVD